MEEEEEEEENIDGRKMEKDVEGKSRRRDGDDLCGNNGGGGNWRLLITSAGRALFVDAAPNLRLRPKPHDASPGVVPSQPPKPYACFRASPSYRPSMDE